jgi:hypothetical protein
MDDAMKYQVDGQRPGPKGLFNRPWFRGLKPPAPSESPPFPGRGFDGRNGRLYGGGDGDGLPGLATRLEC